MRLGFHVSIKDGFSSVPALAVASRSECLQIFSGNPRGWQEKPIAASEADLFRQGCQKAGLTPLVIHASYLLNLCAADRNQLRRSRQALAGELQRAGVLGVDYVVVHMGASGPQNPENALRIMAESVQGALCRIPPGVTLLLENTAGAGSQLGRSFEEIALLLELAGNRDRLGICLDTAHLCAAGYELSSAAQVASVLDDFDRLVGLPRLKLIHLNDSLYPTGSRRDRHTHIGQGFIGKKGMRSLLRERRLRELSAIMETPKDNDKDDLRNMRRARHWRDGWFRSLLSFR